MSDIVSQHTGRSSARESHWAVLTLSASALVMVLILLLPLTVPIGGMYWDLIVYFDAANRIFQGQIPSVDFFAPAGPLGYYLFAGGLKLFPEAQPLLLVSWSFFLVTGPLMALVLWEMAPRHGHAVAFAVLLPFLVFVVFPFNTASIFAYPGSDGYGIYNRQASQLLYVLMAAVIFMRSQGLLAFVIAAVIAALLFTKITGFVAGFLICAFAFLAGRIMLRYALAAAMAFFVLLGFLQVWHGLTLDYLFDMYTLARMNSGELLPRFLYAGSEYFGILAAGGLLVLLLLWVTRARIAELWRSLRQAPSWVRLTAFIDHEALWLGIALFAGLFYETQNSGSQGMILLWPVAVWVVRLHLPSATKTPRAFAAIAILAGIAVTLPTEEVLHRAASTYISSVRNEKVPSENLKTIGSVNARPEIIKMAENMLRIYAAHPETYRDFSRAGVLPVRGYYGAFDFQTALLMAFDRAVSAIRGLEAEKDIRFESMMNLKFVNPFPYLMDRQAPKHIAIGADPTRAVPEPDTEVLEAVRQTDLVLYPTCPPTPDNRALRALYAPALSDHHRIDLDDCYDAFVHPRFEDELGT